MQWLKFKNIFSIWIRIRSVSITFVRDEQVKDSIIPFSILDTCKLLIFDGNSEIGAHVQSDLVYLICSNHLFKSKAVTYLKTMLKKLFIRAQHVLSYILMKYACQCLNSCVNRS